MIDPSTISRAWIDIPGDPPLQVPSYAKPSSLRWNGPILELELNPCPERDAILRGKRFHFDDRPVSGLFTGRAAGGKVQFESKGSCSIDESDLEAAAFLAYCPEQPDGSEKPKEVQATPLRLVQGAPTDECTIKLHAGGLADVSPDLNGRQIHLRVTYPGSIVLDAEPIEIIRVHLLIQVEGRLELATFDECSYECRDRTLLIKTDPAKMNVLPLQVSNAQMAH